jgi:hypothetical protein
MPRQVLAWEDPCISCSQGHKPQNRRQVGEVLVGIHSWKRLVVQDEQAFSSGQWERV